ncbi:MAG: dienelactone hydrolase family protein [Planctomycetaceae bacterium]|nr:dienelactone hydrolase family protein [Planctomycetaceae bacterium]
MYRFIAIIVVLFTSVVFAQTPSEIKKSPGGPLPGTALLDWDEDLVVKLTDAADAFFLAETLETVKRQETFWKRDLSSVEAYEKSLETNRKELARILGVVDERVVFDAPEYIVKRGASPGLAANDSYTVYAIRWPVFGDYIAEGFYISPRRLASRIDIVIPDAGEYPEGLVEKICAAEDKTVATLIPMTVSRTLTEFSAPYPNSRKSTLTNREYLYRGAFEMGRHLIGYEIQQVLALVDWIRKFQTVKDLPIHVKGHRDGGMLAFYAAALDNRIDSVTVHGYFDNRNNIWEEPIDRNVFGRLERFGDAQIAAMIFPRTLKIITPEVGEVEEIPRGNVGAPGKIVPPKPETVEAEANLARSFAAPLAEKIEKKDWLQTSVVPVQTETEKTETTLTHYSPHIRFQSMADTRERRMVAALNKHTQELLHRSPLTRKLFMSKLDTKTPEAFEKSKQFYREYFENEILGKIDKEFLPLNVRSRQAYESDEMVGYEVVMDVYPGMFAYGLLFMPKNMKADEKYPMVVVQHGLDGRVEDQIEGGKPAYNGVLSRLTRKGYITFAPQHLYVLGDKQRQTQRKAYPIKQTAFALMVSMNRQIVRFLATLPNADMERLGYYGLSYGGKSAMRIPPLVDEYKLVICSGDFNRWDVKMVSTFYPYTYPYTIEYEMYTFDMAEKFNYSDLAALIAPRPFFVERGNFDGVGWDEEVGYEAAKVQHLYRAQLDIPDRFEIEWFKGGHRINAVKSFEFLDRFLKR